MDELLTASKVERRRRTMAWALLAPITVAMTVLVLSTAFEVLMANDVYSHRPIEAAKPFSPPTRPLVPEQPCL